MQHNDHSQLSIQLRRSRRYALSSNPHRALVNEVARSSCIESSDLTPSISLYGDTRNTYQFSGAGRDKSIAARRTPRFGRDHSVERLRTDTKGAAIIGLSSRRENHHRPALSSCWKPRIQRGPMISAPSFILLKVMLIRVLLLTIISFPSSSITASSFL